MTDGGSPAHLGEPWNDFGFDRTGEPMHWRNLVSELGALNITHLIYSVTQATPYTSSEIPPPYWTRLGCSAFLVSVVLERRWHWAHLTVSSSILHTVKGGGLQDGVDVSSLRAVHWTTRLSVLGETVAGKLTSFTLTARSVGGDYICAFTPSPCGYTMICGPPRPRRFHSR